MKGNRQKLNECFIWIVLFLVCAVISVFYMAKDYKDTATGLDEEQVTEVSTEVTEIITTEVLQETTAELQESTEEVPSGIIQPE